MTKTARKRSPDGASEAAQAALDVMLTDAAVGGPSRFVRPGAAVSLAAGLARRPGRPVRRLGDLGAELARVAAGRSEVRPAKRDRRFADPAWQSSWLFRRLLQTHLAVGEAVDGLISDAELDWRHERQARFTAGNVLDALAPSNFPWSNPTVIKESVDQGGVNLLRGARNFVDDFPRLPATVDTTKFAVGENLALTAGAVVLRTEVFELIQYAPQTERVREVPLLFAPPTINKYYVLDLAPGRSMAEWLVKQGQQVFMISWRNPDAEQGHFDLDTYAGAVLEARDAVPTIARQPAVHLTGACSGGIIGAGLLGHLAAEGRLGEIASLSLLVVALDNERAGTASALTGREVAAAAIADSARRGYLDGQALSGSSRGCGPTTSCGTTSSTTTCWASRHAPSTSCSGTRTPSGSPPDCTATSSISRWRTRSPARAGSRSSAAASTSAPSISTATSSPDSPTTSSRGRTPTAARSCWAARRASCSRPAATSRRS
jgi:polyhydroxyalkanoate synthase subunit PhaC